MAPIPLDQGAPDRRRIGPFWIEEGTGVVLAGLVIVAAVAVLYAIAFLNRPR